MLLAAQSKPLKSLIKNYSEVEGVTYTEAGKSVIWMVKTAAPKGSMDGVERLTILQFKDGHNSKDFTAFRAATMEICREHEILCAAREKTKKGSIEVHMQRSESPKEYIMFMSGDDGSEVVMYMEGELPSSLDMKVAK